MKQHKNMPIPVATCGSAAVRFLRMWVRIAPGGRMSFSCECCVCCHVVVSAKSLSLVQKSPTECGASCVTKKPQELGGHRPRWAAERHKKKYTKYRWQYTSHEYATGSKEGENGVFNDVQYSLKLSHTCVLPTGGWGYKPTSSHACLLACLPQKHTPFFLIQQTYQAVLYGVQEKQCGEDTGSF